MGRIGPERSTVSSTEVTQVWTGEAPLSRRHATDAGTRWMDWFSLVLAIRRSEAVAA